MTDRITDSALDELLSAADPLRSQALPSVADTERALRRLLVAGPERTRARGATTYRRWARPGPVASAILGLAAVAAALVLLLGATTSQPALAITRNPDGTVTVKLNKLSSIPAANRKLAELGIKARIGAGLGCRPPQGHRPPQGPPGEVRAPGSQVITFRPGSRMEVFCYRVAVTPAGNRREAARP